MAEMNPFDPTTWTTAGAHTAAEQAAQPDAHRVQAVLMAEMAMTFLETLERHALPHAEALYLTAHIWRAP